MITTKEFERPAIERFVRAWQEAFDPGEYEAMAGSYSDEAVLSGTGVPPVIGREAIRQFWRTSCEGAKRAGIQRTVHTDQYDSCGDVAYLQGTVTLKATNHTAVVWFVTVPITRRTAPLDPGRPRPSLLLIQVHAESGPLFRRLLFQAEL